MLPVLPVTLARDPVRLVPLGPEHEPGLAAAAADGELWKIRVTSVPEPGATRGYIETALQMQTQGTRVPDVYKRQGWSCASCHGNPPTGKGVNALSEKPIPALAPAFNPASFTDRSKVDGWFKNNCKDVLNRECTMAEKADVLSWLLTLKP